MLRVKTKGSQAKLTDDPDVEDGGTQSARLCGCWQVSLSLTNTYSLTITLYTLEAGNIKENKDKFFWPWGS